MNDPSAPVVTLAEVTPAEALPAAAGSPHIAVLVSLNFPDLTEPVAELVPRFTRNALAAVTAAGASHTLVDSSVPEDEGGGDRELTLLVTALLAAVRRGH